MVFDQIEINPCLMKHNVTATIFPSYLRTLLTAVSGSRMPPAVFVAGCNFSTRTLSSRGMRRFAIFTGTNFKQSPCQCNCHMLRSFWNELAQSPRRMHACGDKRRNQIWTKGSEFKILVRKLCNATSVMDPRIAPVRLRCIHDVRVVRIAIASKNKVIKCSSIDLGDLLLGTWHSTYNTTSPSVALHFKQFKCYLTILGWW